VEHVLKHLDVPLDIFAIGKILRVPQLQAGVLELAFQGPADYPQFVVGEQDFVCHGMPPLT
jgi:hypothetical protein